MELGIQTRTDFKNKNVASFPSLYKDATLDAIYAYAHAIDYDYETDIGSIEDLSYRLSKDDSHLIISGLNGWDNIAIHPVGGKKITGLPTAPADMNKASIDFPEGQVYIILINGVSIKWKH